MDVTMERTKSPTKNSRRKAGNKKKPLIDISNTIPSSQHSSQSSSSSIKFKPKIRSSFSLALKSLPNNSDTNLNPKSKLTTTGSTTNINNNDEKKKKTKKANPSSRLSASSETPFGSVYRRQHTAEKRKSKGKETAEPLSCIFETRIPDLRKKKGGDDDIGISKSFPVPHKKKQRQANAEINASEHELVQDFIDKQRAYFAEVDAFELEEEVASGNESS